MIQGTKVIIKVEGKGLRRGRRVVRRRSVMTNRSWRNKVGNLNIREGLESQSSFARESSYVVRVVVRPRVSPRHRLERHGPVARRRGPPREQRATRALRRRRHHRRRRHEPPGLDPHARLLRPRLWRRRREARPRQRHAGRSARLRRRRRRRVAAARDVPRGGRASPSRHHRPFRDRATRAPRRARRDARDPPRSPRRPRHLGRSRRPRTPARSRSRPSASAAVPAR